MGASSKARDEAQILALIDDWTKAVRAKDVDGVLSHLAADVVTFDLHADFWTLAYQAIDN